MTHEGVKNLMRVMTAAYPNYHPSDMGGTIAIWETLLASYDDAQGAAALKAYILSDTKGFAPAIGQIVDIIQGDPDELGEMEAWDMVIRAVRNGIYGAEREFAKLPDTVKAALGGAGQLREWAQIDQDSLNTVAQSNFMRAYRAASERERKAVKMTPELRCLYQRTRTFPELTVEEPEEPMTEGIPMPEELKLRLMERRNR